MHYGLILKQLRERIGLTLVEVSKLINVSDSLYSRYEKEKQTIPIKHLNTLCNYFNVSIDYIFSFTNIKNYNNSSKNINIKVSGQRLNELRKELNYTQDKFAKKISVARSLVSEYENGNFLIATSTLYTICTKYNISADYLLVLIKKLL